MTWLVVAFAAIAVVVIALSLRSHSRHDPGGEPGAEREPRPGEGMDHQFVIPNVPGGFVTLRAALPASEAYVVQSLLLANGIETALQPASGSAAVQAYTRAQPTALSVLVPGEQADEAEGMLRELDGTP